MEKKSIEYVLPEEIEKRSFEIIAAELAERGITLPAEQDPVTRRVIHTSADFDYAETMTYSENAVEIAKNLIKNGADIVTDTNMALAGSIRRRWLLLAGKPTAIWRMRMWRLWRRNGRPPGRLSAWSWLRSWKNQ